MYTQQAALIMNKFKKHAKEEVAVGSTVSRSATSPADLKKSSGLIFAPPTLTSTSSASNKASSKDTMVCEYHLDYVGKFEVPSPATSNENQVETVDNIVAKLRENQKGKPKTRRSLSAMFKGIGKGSPTNSRDSDSIDGMAASNSASSLLDEADSPLTLNVRSVSSEEEGSSTDISVTVTTASSEEVLTSPMNAHRSMSQTDGEEDGGRGVNGSEVKGGSSPNLFKLEGGESEEGKQNGVEGTKAPLSNGSLPSGDVKVDAGHNGGQKSDEVVNGSVKGERGGDMGGVLRASTDSVSSEFDTLPELAKLKDSYAFQILSLNQSQRVKLVFSGLTVAMFSERGGEQLLGLNVRNISCCAQVSQVKFTQLHVHVRKAYCLRF